MVELHLASGRSLKEKRMVLNRIKDRLRRRFHLAVAEVGHQDRWQRAALALVAVGNDRTELASLLERAQAELEGELPGEATSAGVEWLV